MCPRIVLWQSGDFSSKEYRVWGTLGKSTVLMEKTGGKASGQDSVQYTRFEKITSSMLGTPSKGVPAVARRLHAAQRKIVNLLKTLWGFFVFVSVCVFNVWPKTTPKGWNKPWNLDGFWHIKVCQVIPLCPTSLHLWPLFAFCSRLSENCLWYLTHLKNLLVLQN